MYRARFLSPHTGATSRRRRLWLSVLIAVLVMPALWSPVAGSVPTPSLSLAPLPDTGSETQAGTPDAPMAVITDPMARYLAPPGANRPRYEIVINLPSFQLRLYKDGELFRQYPIAIGSIVSPSNLGTERIINKVANPTYYPPDWGKKGLKPIPPGPDNPVGTRWLGLSMKGYGIHGTNNPASIGKAASSGCIRMYNKDVEELASIVPVNTPVTFVYDLVTAWVDAASRHPMLQVFEDVYEQGKPTWTQAASLLRSLPLSASLNEEALHWIVAAAEGKAEPAPLDHTLELDGVGPVRGYRAAGRTFVSLPALAARLGEMPALNLSPVVTVYGSEVKGAWHWEGAAYAPLAAAAAAFGLLADEEESVLYRLRLHADGSELPWRSFVAGGELLVPLEPLAALVGRAVTCGTDDGTCWVSDLPVEPARVIGGTIYISYLDAARLLGVEVRWEPGAPAAFLVWPQEDGASE